MKNLLTITTKKHILSGKANGMEWRHKFNLDELDKNNEIYTFSFPKNLTPSISFLHGLFDASLVKLDDDFIEKYHFTGTNIKQSINNYCELTFTTIDKFANEGKIYKY